MPAGTYADFKLDDQYFHTGTVEGLTQNLDAFNEASGGAIRLIDDRMPGHYNHTLGYKNVEDAWTRRDIDAATAVTSTDTRKIAETDQIGVKFNAKMFMPQTLNQFQKNFDPQMKGDYQEISNRIGSWTTVALLKMRLNQALMSVRAALMNSAATANKHSPTVSSANYNGKLNSGDLITGLSKLGDAAGRVMIWVMHSTSWFDLMKNQHQDKVVNVADFVLYQASAATLNRPVLVTDSPGLVATIGSGSTAYTEYYTLGLTEDAVQVKASEKETMIVMPVTGKENIELNIQGEAAHNIEVKGAAWDFGNGGKNPTEAALATASNWDPTTNHFKNRAGVVINHRGTA